MHWRRSSPRVSTVPASLSAMLFDCPHVLQCCIQRNKLLGDKSFFGAGFIDLSGVICQPCTRVYLPCCFQRAQYPSKWSVPYFLQGAAYPRRNSQSISNITTMTRSRSTYDSAAEGPPQGKRLLSNDRKRVHLSAAESSTSYCEQVTG